MTRNAFARTGLALALALAAGAAAAVAVPIPLRTLGGQVPIVISHRGSTGYLPEHTIAGYELAVRMGTDYIEPDLQMTRDGVLVAIHDDTLNRTTNVASLFAPRNGRYNVADFTLAEIKTLTVRPTGSASSTYPGFTPSDNYANRVPTFQEVIDTAKAMSAQAGREIGIYPEAKQGDQAMADAIMSTLIANGYTAGSKLFIQSFSADTIRYLNAQQNLLDPKYDFPLVVLGSVNAINAIGLQNINDFAEGVGVSISGSAVTAAYQLLIDNAHDADLLVHGWTFGNNPAQYLSYFNAGIDGVFSNFTDIADTVRDVVVANSLPEPSSAPLALLTLLGLAGAAGAAQRRRGADAGGATARSLRGA